MEGKPVKNNVEMLLWLLLGAFLVLGVGLSHQLPPEAPPATPTRLFVVNNDLLVFDGRTGPDGRHMLAVRRDPRVQKALARYDVVDFMDDARNADHYKVTAYPTFVIRDKAGMELARKTGDLSAQEFSAWLEHFATVRSF